MIRTKLAAAVGALVLMTSMSACPALASGPVQPDSLLACQVPLVKPICDLFRR